MKFKVEFDARRCGGAGECLAVCDRGVWDWREIEISFFGRKIRKFIPFPSNQENCVGCKKCEMICPTGCIRVVEQKA